MITRKPLLNTATPYAVLFYLCLATAGHAQLKQPVKWRAEGVCVDSKQAVITITALMDEPWHIYSQYMEEGGPLPTSFRFIPSDDYKLDGKVVEITEPVEKFDHTFMMPVRWFEGTRAVFEQRILLNAPSATVTFEVVFMACTDEECLLPETKRFIIEIKELEDAPSQKKKKKRKRECKE